MVVVKHGILHSVRTCYLWHEYQCIVLLTACGENLSSKSPASTGTNNGTAHSTGPNGTSKPQTKSTTAPSKTPNVTLAPNTTATPGNSTAAPGNSTAAPGNSTAAPGNSTAAPRNSTTRPTTVTKVPSSKPGNHSSNPNVTPTPKGINNCLLDLGPVNHSLKPFLCYYGEVWSRNSVIEKEI